jgi:flagellar hook assembly protein FlgD
MNTATAVNGTPLLPAWTLGSNYPNPFLDRTRMNLDLPMQSNVKVDVFDVAGRHVRHDELGLVNAGRTQLVFDGRDHNGAALPSGVYFYKVHTAAGTLTRKMVITR